MLPLPDGWSAPSLVEDVIVADGVSLRRAGLCSTAPSGEEVTGSAAGVSGDVVARGRFELLERASTVEAIRRDGEALVRDRDGQDIAAIATRELFPISDAPDRWRPARSSGVALHAGWRDACDRALWEVVERDRVLRSWYGAAAPRCEAFDAAAHGLGATSRYDWEAHRFVDDDPPPWSDGIVVVGVFGFPRDAGVPLVLGYGARPDASAATAAAAAEAAQLLAFLWGEDLPTTPPAPGPTPMHHLENLLWSGTAPRLRRWLAGEHVRWGGAAPRRPPADPGGPRYADLTPGWMPDGLRVARAIVPDATPLAFGDAPGAAHLPAELRIHPIP